MIARPVLLQLLNDAVAPTTSEDNDENDAEKVEMSLTENESGDGDGVPHPVK